MPVRPISDTIAVLHRTLEEIEREVDPVSDSLALGELKRIVLNRIAELELESALQERSSAPMMHAAIGEAPAPEPVPPSLPQPTAAPKKS